MGMTQHEKNLADQRAHLAREDEEARRIFQERERREKSGPFTDYAAMSAALVVGLFAWAIIVNVAEGNVRELVGIGAVVLYFYWYFKIHKP